MRPRFIASLLFASLAASVLAVAGCGHDWDQFDRVTVGGGGGATSTGGGTKSHGTGTSNGGGGSSDGGAGGSTLCGNSRIDPGEECDDGNATAGDGCTNCKVDCVAPDFKDPTTFHCYHVDTALKEWDQARTACMKLGGDLAALSTHAEYDFVKPHLPAARTWTGGNDQVTEGTFVWSNGEPWIYATGDSAWGIGQPSDSFGALDCIQSNFGALFEDFCNVPYAYVCERVPAGG